MSTNRTALLSQRLPRIIGPEELGLASLDLPLLLARCGAPERPPGKEIPFNSLQRMIARGLAEGD